MNVVLYQLGPDAHPDLRGLWVANIHSAGVWFRAPSRATLVADVGNMESRDWGYL